MRDHGGDLDRARALYGAQDWIDLSTGINRVPYPLPDLPACAWTDLPHAAELTALERAARDRYNATGGVIAVSGAQAAIQLVPHLAPPARAAVLSPSYNEHAAALLACGWHVAPAPDLDAMVGADLAVVVNPNNPDGRFWSPSDLIALSDKVGLLVVDESFADPTPDLSLAPHLHRLGKRVLVLRSFGKFYGLAGLRLGFVLTGSTDLADRVRALSGPWAVSGPALEIGRAALADGDWHRATTARLMDDSARLAQLGQTCAGWSVVGHTALFCTFDTGNAQAAQVQLARAGLWSRRFPYSAGWLRLGLPVTAQEWTRLERALSNPT
jgi:cobalamin biosynthetic protein CobC